MECCVNSFCHLPAFSLYHLVHLTLWGHLNFQVFVEVTFAVPDPDRGGDTTHAELKRSSIRASSGINSRSCRAFGPLWRIQPPICSYVWGRWSS